METNFIACVTRFGIERDVFVVACDSGGLRWLEERFNALSKCAKNSFIIGDGTKISSDGQCQIKVVGGIGGRKCEIIQDDHFDYTWYVEKGDIAEISEKLFNLRQSSEPCHNYFDVGSGHWQTVVVKKDEYRTDIIRAMRDDSHASN